jgi:hypothetical protein
MHLFGQNLARRLREYFRPYPERNVLPDVETRNYPFLLINNRTMKHVGQDMVLSRPLLAGHFDGNWTDISSGSSRAVDWLDFLLYALPTLVIPYLQNKKTKEILNNLVIACHLSLRWEVRPEDMDFVRK